MSAWNHRCCEGCWQDLHPNRVPCRVKDAKEAPCCFCGFPTVSGIFIRFDPKEMPRCRGLHDDEPATA